MGKIKEIKRVTANQHEIEMLLKGENEVVKLRVTKVHDREGLFYAVDIEMREKVGMKAYFSKGEIQLQMDDCYIIGAFPVRDLGAVESACYRLRMLRDWFKLTGFRWTVDHTNLMGQLIASLENQIA
jgi:hypothetical protein